MSRIHVPSIKGYECYRKYLNDVILSKEVENSPMSYRFLAKKVNCSPSYLNDVAKGRTNLRLGKAMAIADFLGMDSASKTHWILLLLKEIETPEVSSYFTNQLLKMESPAWAAKPILDQDLKIEVVEMAIYSIIVWKNGKTNPADIVKELNTFSVTEITVLECIDRWIERGYLASLPEGGYKVSTDQIYIEAEGARANAIQIQFKENFIRYCDEPRSLGRYDSGFIVVPYTKMPEAIKKFRELRNWLFETEREYFAENESTRDESELFQYDLDLFSVCSSGKCPDFVKAAIRGTKPKVGI